MPKPDARPLALRPGSRVAVACPASPVQAGALERGVDRLRGLGFDVVVGASCAVREPVLLAGDDAARARELLGFLLDPSIDAVFAGRGGVGCMRLLPFLDEIPFGAPPRWLIGRSDLTALHVALWGRLGWIGLSGPMVAPDFGNEPAPEARVIERTMRLLADPRPVGVVHRFDEGIGAGEALRTLRRGTAEGPLIPANLSVLTSMLGTPYMPDLSGTILVLEDIGEPPHRIDRMLTQLRLAGVLGRLAGLVFGQFTGCTPRADSGLPADLCDRILRSAAESGYVDGPVVAGLPYGHERLFTPLPVGVRARLSSDPPELVLLEGAARAVGNHHAAGGESG